MSPTMPNATGLAIIDRIDHKLCTLMMLYAELKSLSINSTLAKSEASTMTHHQHDDYNTILAHVLPLVTRNLDLPNACKFKLL